MNLTAGPDANALTAETLDDAVQLGLDMAKTFPPATPAHIAAKIPPGKVLTGKDALDLAKAIVQDPQVNARPENREALEELGDCADDNAAIETARFYLRTSAADTIRVHRDAPLYPLGEMIAELKSSVGAVERRHQDRSAQAVRGHTREPSRPTLAARS